VQARTAVGSGVKRLRIPWRWGAQGYPEGRKWEVNRGWEGEFKKASAAAGGGKNHNNLATSSVWPGEKKTR